MEHAEEIDNLGGDAPTMPSARAAKEAAPPTEEQVKTHELTHANYELWCEHCVAGRGQEAKHLKVKADTQPPDTLVVQMDYLFIAADGSQTAQGRESVTVLVCVDDRGAVEACVSTKKGPQDTYAIKVMAKFLDGLGAKKIILQTDGENAIQSVARRMAKEAIPTVTLRTTPAV